jgi:uncharacterized phiE125 gp8 family phage protein
MPVSITDLKRQLNISILNNDFDDQLTWCLESAVAQVEKYTNRKLLTTNVTEYFDAFPDSDRLVLPYGNLVSVTSLTYRDVDGDWNTFSSTYYSVEIVDEPGAIVLNDGYTWPTTTLHPSKPVKVIFVCGYGDTGSTVPYPIRQAILLIAADLFEHRELHVAGVSVQTMQTDRILLSNYVLHGGF